MELRYLLDTNICIYIAKQKPMSVLERFEKLAVGSVGMSIITYGELYYGAQKSHRPRKTKQFLEELIGLISPLPLPIDAAKAYGWRTYIIQRACAHLRNGETAYDSGYNAAMDTINSSYGTSFMREYNSIPDYEFQSLLQSGIISTCPDVLY